MVREELKTELEVEGFVCVCVCVSEHRAWREGIFGLHAVLNKFVIARWMLWSILTMNISNDPGRGFACVVLSEQDCSNEL